MAMRKGGLQKNVRSIFQDAAMPDDIHLEPPSGETSADGDPVVETPELAREPQTDALPVQETEVSVPEVPVPQPQPEAQPQSEPSEAAHGGACLADPMIEGQMKKQKCENDFSCYTSGYKDLCQARVIRHGKTVQCLEPKKNPCSYRISTFFKRLCQCPIRIHIAKKHKK